MAFDNSWREQSVFDVSHEDSEEEDIGPREVANHPQAPQIPTDPPASINLLPPIIQPPIAINSNMSENSDVQIPEAELAVRSDVTSHADKVTALLTIGNSRYNCKAILKEIRESHALINSLKIKVTERCRNADSTEFKTAINKEWINWVIRVETILGDAEIQVEEWTNPAVVVDPVQVEATKRANILKKKIAPFKKKISSLQTKVKDQLEFVTKEPNAQPISKSKYMVYSKASDEMKDSLSILENIIDECLQIDPDDDENKIAQLSKELSSVSSNITKFNHSFAGLNIPDDTLPSSTPNTSAILTESTNVSSTTLKSSAYFHSYKKGEKPKFSGDIRDFACWLSEWQECVIPSWGETSTPAIIRDLHKHTPDEDNLLLYDTLEDAIEYLKTKYSNPFAVSAVVMQEFHATAKVKGANNHQVIVNVESLIKQLHQRLVKVNQESQLVDSFFSMNHAISLLPMQTREEFAKEQDMKIQSLPTGEIFTANNLWTLLVQFLKQKRTMIHQHFPLELKAKCKAEESTGKSGKKQIGVIKTGLNKDHSQANFSKNVHSDNKIADMQRRFGKCTVCTGYHTWNSKRNGVQASSRLSNCEKFMDMDLETRATTVEKVNVCFRCLDYTHEKTNCKFSVTAFSCIFKDTNGVKCGKDHHAKLHGSKHRLVGLCQVKQLAIPDKPPILMAVTPISVNGVFDVAFFDHGSNSSLITHKLACKLGLKGKIVKEYVERVGASDPEEFEVAHYSLCWKITPQLTKKVDLIGMDFITSNHSPPDISRIRHLFPHIPDDVFVRPTGEIGLLIGLDNNSLLPGGGLGDDMVGDLRAMKIPFNPGFVITGHHPELVFDQHEFSSSASFWRNAKRQIRSSVNLLQTARTCVCLAKTTMDPLEADILGYNLPARCVKCQNCDDCTIQVPGRSIKDHKDLQEMKESMYYDADKKIVTVQYPLKGDLRQFKDNRYQAIQRAESLWKSLTQKKMLETYNEQIQDYISRGVWSPIMESDLEIWKSSKNKPLHYFAHHAVYNSHSLSTPVRSVVDSTVKNCGKGPSINDVYKTGPNIMGDLYNILIRWRSYNKALSYDVTKAYHSIHVAEQERMMRLVVWRFSADSPWVTYTNNRLGFGCPPSSCFLELVKRLASELGFSIDPMAASQLRNQSYVDDVPGGGQDSDVKRMRGNTRVLEDGKLEYDATVSQIISLVNMSPKMIVCSGDTDEATLSKVGKTLGHLWHPSKDLLKFSPVVNLYKRNGALKTGPDVSSMDIDKILAMTLTKRICLQQVAAQYDPLGLIAPYLIKGRIYLRELVSLQLDWDTPIPQESRKQWHDYLIDMVSVKAITFPRAIVTDHVLGRPEVLGFFDASDVCYAAVIYIRYQLNQPDQWHVSVLTSKARVVPSSGLTTPRSELSGTVMLSRLVTRVVNSLSIRPQRISLFGDSSCVIASLEETCNSMLPFFSNRVLEITNAMESWGSANETDGLSETPKDVTESLAADTTLVDKVYHVPTDQNPADLPTRGNVPWDSLGPDSVWQNGLEWMRKNRSFWPISRKFVRQDVPNQEKRKNFRSVFTLMTHHRKPTNKLEEVMFKYNDLRKVQSILARIVRGGKYGRDAIFDVPSHEDMDNSWWLMCLLSMGPTLEMMKKKNLSTLDPFFREGLVRTTGRVTAKSMMKHLQHESLVILSPSCRLSYLIMKQAHEENHRRSSGDALFRSRKYGVWIIKGHNLAKAIVSACMYCKKLAAVTTTQQMGSLPDSKFELPTSPFTHATVDFLGHWSVVDSVKRRVKKKVYPLVFCCLVTGTITIIIADGYSLDSFLIAFDTFKALRGTPLTLYSDAGSQLKMAGKLCNEKVKKDMLPGLDFDKINTKLGNRGTVFRSAPSGAQHRDGLSESAVKQIKHTCQHLLKPGGSLTCLELQSLFHRVADVINQRAIGVRHHNKSEPGVCVLTPNLLLLGSRTDYGIPTGELLQEDPHRNTKRLRFLECCFQNWWQEWFRTCFADLLPIKKWKTRERNLRVDDIVLIQYLQKYSKPEHRLARVLNVKPDEKGLIRTVTVGYRSRSKDEKQIDSQTGDFLPYEKKKLTEIEVPVQRLIVLMPVEEQHLDPDYQYPRDCQENVPHICPYAPASGADDDLLSGTMQD